MPILLGWYSDFGFYHDHFKCQTVWHAFEDVMCNAAQILVWFFVLCSILVPFPSLLVTQLAVVECYLTKDGLPNSSSWTLCPLRSRSRFLLKLTPETDSTLSTLHSEGLKPLTQFISNIHHQANHIPHSTTTPILRPLLHPSIAPCVHR